MPRVIVVNLTGFEGEDCRRLFSRLSGFDLAERPGLSSVLLAWENQIRKQRESATKPGSKRPKTRFSVKGLSRISALQDGEKGNAPDFEYLLVPPGLLPVVRDLYTALDCDSCAVLLGDPEDWIAAQRQANLADAEKHWQDAADLLLKFHASTPDVVSILPAQTLMTLSSELPEGLLRVSWLKSGKADKARIDTGASLDWAGSLRELLELQGSRALENRYLKLRNLLVSAEECHDGSWKSRLLFKVSQLSQAAKQDEQDVLPTSLLQELGALRTDNHILQLIVAQLKEELETSAQTGVPSLPVTFHRKLNPQIVRMARAVRTH